jgi:predicted O-methyltransferase YrrM
MRLNGEPEEITATIVRGFPKVPRILEATTALVPWSKRQIEPYQAAVLYALARQYNYPGASILEIGTAFGYSAAIVALACPEAMITTLNPKPAEFPKAEENLRSLGNITVLQICSWDYLAMYKGATLDMVFVDGNHEEIRRDLPWWDWLRVDGLMLFHDYSPAGSKRPSPPVFEAVNEFAEMRGREPDVLVVDHRSIGMAGFYKQQTEVTHG